MRVFLLLCLCSVAWSDRNHGGRRRNMLDQNRTPRRQGLAEDAETLFESLDSTSSLTGTSCDLKGAWYNQHGSELFLNQTEDGKLTGEYRTGVKLGARGEAQGKYKSWSSELDSLQSCLPEYTERSNFAPVHGRVFGRLFTFHVYWREKNAVTTWSGQCQRNCDFGWLRSDRDILHASWLITSSVSQCDEYWSATRYGSSPHPPSETLLPKTYLSESAKTFSRVSR